MAEKGRDDLAIEALLRTGQDAKIVSAVGGRIAKVLSREKHGSRRKHDVGIWDSKPGSVIVFEVTNQLGCERVSGGGHHEAVGDTNGESIDVGDGKATQRAQGATAFEIKVKEDAAKVV